MELFAVPWIFRFFFKNNWYSLERRSLGLNPMFVFSHSLILSSLVTFCAPFYLLSDHFFQLSFHTTLWATDKAAFWVYFYSADFDRWIWFWCWFSRSSSANVAIEALLPKCIPTIKSVFVGLVKWWVSKKYTKFVRSQFCLIAFVHLFMWFCSRTIWVWWDTSSDFE